MRFNFNFESDGTIIPKDYRRGFASIIKNALYRADKKLFEYFYNGRFKIKPFTFSVYFPYGSKYVNDNFEIGNHIVLKVSTNDVRFAAALYNGMQNLRYESYPFFDNKIILKSIILNPPKKIEKNEIRFKIISPLLVTNKNCHIHQDDKQYDIYLSPEDDGFDEGLRFLTYEQIKNFLNIDEQIPFDYEFEKGTLKVSPVWHYNQWNKSIKGRLILRSHPQILQLLYDTGIGARRSQGFGMLEVIE